VSENVEAVADGAEAFDTPATVVMVEVGGRTAAAALVALAADPAGTSDVTEVVVVELFAAAPADFVASPHAASSNPVLPASRSARRETSFGRLIVGMTRTVRTQPRDCLEVDLQVFARFAA
jgi:hypothetical protein